MLKYGVVPSEEYREWGDQAIALACMCRRNRVGVKWAVSKLAAWCLFNLSHFDEHPDVVTEGIVAEAEDLVERIESANIPLGISVKDAFLQYEGYDEKYLYSILSRLSFKSGRKKKPRKKRK